MFGSTSFTFRMTIRNPSAWPTDIVWENAQDLEHVGTLHRRTNYAFELLDVRPSRDGTALYESLIFMVRRRLLGLIPIVTFGFRRVVGPGEIWQIEVSPLLGITTALRSTLERNGADPSRTDLVDSMEVSMPRILRPLRGFLEAALRRHARLQCGEDETVRARRHELRARGINLPASILNEPLWEKAFGRGGAPATAGAPESRSA